MKTISRYIMTLALLLTAATGAWAADTYTITFSGFGNEACNKTVTDATLEYSETFNIADVDANYMELVNVSGSNDYVSISNSQENITITVKSAFEGTVKVTVSYLNGGGDESQSDISVTCVKSEPAIDVTPVTGKTNEWTFTMPAYDVEIAPIYAPVAQWAKVDNVDQLPTAIEGIFAESTDAIVTPGKVAKIGDTENPQGIVMYAVTSTNQATAPALTAFSADVPTAKDIKVGSDVLVWYYIKGADTPTGETATAENTFNDSEICATPLTVTVLSNKFDITFKAANANTIEAGKATVKVGETDADVKEGKLTGVKMGSEVKVKAKDGYKFRKAEGKKGGLLSIEIGGVTTATIYYVEGETWGQAIQNHPTENSVWKIDNGYISGNGVSLFVGDDFVSPDSTIDPKANYSFQWT